WGGHGVARRPPRPARRPWPGPSPEDRQMTQNAGDYAFPHANTAESRRLDLFAGRLDPVTKRRIGQLGLGPAVRCLEIGGGRGSIARWLCEDVAPQGHVTATDLETGFLSRLALPNLTVL